MNGAVFDWGVGGVVEEEALPFAEFTDEPLLVPGVAGTAAVFGPVPFGGVVVMVDGSLGVGPDPIGATGVVC